MSPHVARASAIAIMAMMMAGEGAWAQSSGATVIIDDVVVEAGRLTVVDGDSIAVDGAEWRVMGYDTPETQRAGCEGERRLGLKATERLGQLIGSASRVEIIWSGQNDRYRRRLVTLTIDGRLAADTMIAENFARPYQGGRRKGWCSRDSRDDLVPGLPPARDRKGAGG